MKYKGYKITVRKSGKYQITVITKHGEQLRIFEELEAVKRYIDNIEAMNDLAEALARNPW